MPPKPKPRTSRRRDVSTSREAELEARAAFRGYTIEKTDDHWYAKIGGTRYGPMASLDDLDEFLPRE